MTLREIFETHHAGDDCAYLRWACQQAADYRAETGRTIAEDRAGFDAWVRRREIVAVENQERAGAEREMG